MTLVVLLTFGLLFYFVAQSIKAHHRMDLNSLIIHVLLAIYVLLLLFLHFFTPSG